MLQGFASSVRQSGTLQQLSGLRKRRKVLLVPSKPRTQTSSEQKVQPANTQDSAASHGQPVEPLINVAPFEHDQASLECITDQPAVPMQCRNPDAAVKPASRMEPFSSTPMNEASRRDRNMKPSYEARTESIATDSVMTGLKVSSEMMVDHDSPSKLPSARAKASELAYKTSAESIVEASKRPHADQQRAGNNGPCGMQKVPLQPTSQTAAAAIPAAELQKMEQTEPLNNACLEQVDGSTSRMYTHADGSKTAPVIKGAGLSEEESGIGHRQAHWRVDDPQSEAQKAQAGNSKLAQMSTQAPRLFITAPDKGESPQVKYTGRDCCFRCCGSMHFAVNTYFIMHIILLHRNSRFQSKDLRI